MVDNLREDVFSQLFVSGAVRFVDVQIASDGRARLVYTLNTGVTGLVYTKLGRVKRYKPETALRYLRALGLASVRVEMKDWSPSAVQRPLL